MTVKIRFQCEIDGSEKIAPAEIGERLTAVAYRAGVVIQQTCGGSPSCTDCKIVVKEGVDEGFESPKGAEIRLLGNVYFITHERLSCQAIVKGDATVYVPSPRQQNRQRAKKSFERNRDVGRKDLSGGRNHGEQKKEKDRKKNR